MDNSDEGEKWNILGAPEIIIKALLEQKFYSPTEIQALVLPPAILGRRDILGAAETGSGKTLAFGIPILNGILELMKNKEKRILSSSGVFKEISTDVCDYIDDKNSNNYISDKSTSLEKSNNYCSTPIDLTNAINENKFDNFNIISKPLYALILTPTRELAFQIQSHLLNAAKFTDIKIAVVVGGMAAVKQERILNKGPEIVIATPGRLWELLADGNNHLNQIDSIKYLVIDETDRMLEKGHFTELYNILDKLNTKDSKYQTFVFSATLTLVHDIPNYLLKKKLKNSKGKTLSLTSSQKLKKVIEILKIKNPKIIDVTKSKGTAENLTESRIACTIDHKDYYLYYFLKKHPGRTLIFCNSIGCVKRLSTLFSILKCKPLPLHASMPQQQRLTNLERFQASQYGVLIATDVAARGLDIPHIQHVIHYQVPRTSESYIHRCGRTARAEKEGITVLMMEPSEKHLYSRLCKTLNRTEDLPSFPVIDHLLIAVKERVNVAREIDKLELSFKRDNSRKSWLEKAARDMDLVLDNEETSFTEIKREAHLKRLLKVKRSLLENLLNKPLFPNNFSGKYPDNSLETSLNQSSENAIDVMKKYIEDYPKLKKKRLCIPIAKKNCVKRN